MTYLLDTNVFIEAANRHYGFEFCPAFWDWLIEQRKYGKVLSIDKVRDELLKHKDRLSEHEDPLHDWVLNDGAALFLPTDGEVTKLFSHINNWIESQKYEQGAKDEFYESADYYIIAHALKGNYVVVTHEVASNSCRKIKIPNVCEGLSVKCKTPYEMLREAKPQFVLRKS